MHSDSVEVDEHMSRSAEDLADSVGRRILHEPWVFYATQERVKRGVDFQAGQCPPKHTWMLRPQPTRSLSLRSGSKVFRLAKRRGLRFAAPLHQEDGRTLRDCGAGDLDAGQCRAAGEELHRGLQPQHFLDGTGNQLGSVAQQRDGPGTA
jgi:hypothetical protein